MEPLKTFRNLTQEKQERICRVAVEEFSKNGFSGASINIMVKRLGIAKGSIFQYFGDKQTLFLFAFNTAMKEVKRYLKSARDNTVDEPLARRLEETLLAGIAFLKEHPVIYRLYLRVMFESGIPFREKILLSLRRYSFQYLKGLLETARKRGEIRRELDLDQAAFLLDAVMDRFLQAQVISHLDAGIGLYACDQDTAKQWSNHIVDMLRWGIGDKGFCEK